MLALLALLAVGALILGPISSWMSDSDTSLDSTRERWIQFLALTAVLVAVLQWRVATSQRHDDAYYNAVQLLGAESATQRAAGALALESVMRDQPQRHAQIVELLGTLAREVARDPDYEAHVSTTTKKIRPRVDIQTVLTVLGRRDPEAQQFDKIRLADGYFAGANLRGAHLESATLRRANLENARLEEAFMRSAELRGAHLNHADLEDADLRYANLSGASLLDTRVDGAHFAGAKRADLSTAQRENVHCKPEDSCPGREPGG
ncbi:pentapeptide repeat-containing protein [Ilumatobacter nonamiensis]|uniref:pentapeptide repeat-containing protein n=1 Tax=Ilumatobacter nonamiensis TaxID=467093 RepID=UPI0006844978|nr:pentapeptide repeat-containing protein [Ilumatobacter nonamiensis]